MASSNNHSRVTEASENLLLKIIIIGDSAVGKTNILMRFCEEAPKQNYSATIGVDFRVRSVKVGDTRIKFQIWDTAGQERYRHIARTYYKGAAGVVLAYSITDRKSFENIHSWATQMDEHASGDIKRILVGNKSDLGSQREVTPAEGKQLADKYGMKFLEVSARSGANIPDVFDVLAKDIVGSMSKSDPRYEHAKLQLTPQQNDQKCNC